MSNFQVYRSAAIAGTSQARRKSEEQTRYERGFEAATLRADYRDNFVNRVRQDGGAGNSKLTLPSPPALPSSADLRANPASLQAIVQASEAQELATLDAIGKLATEQLCNATSAAEGERIAGTQTSQAAAAVEVAKAQLAVAQVAEAVAQTHERSAQRSAQLKAYDAQREEAARKQTEKAQAAPPVAGEAVAPSTFTSLREWFSAFVATGATSAR